MAKLSKEDHKYRHAKGSVSSLNYHFVFCPKRRKAVLVGKVAERLQEVIFDVVKEHGWHLVALEIMPDHVHLFVNAPTHESPAEIIRWVKGRASKYLRQEFPGLKKLPCLWSPSYFVASTGQTSTETVKRYIENQRSA
jgi:putative transposase